MTMSLRLACVSCLFQAGSRFQGGSRSASGRTSTLFVTMSLRLACASCFFQVGARFAVFRDDVVAFGLCVLFVSTRRAVRGLCRVVLRVFVAMSLRMGCVCVRQPRGRRRISLPFGVAMNVTLGL